MNGNTERVQCDLSWVYIPLEKEKKGNEKNKTFIKYLKKVNKKKSFHLWHVGSNDQGLLTKRFGSIWLLQGGVGYSMARR